MNRNFNRVLVFVGLFAFITGSTFAVEAINAKDRILSATSRPVFSKAERHSELAARRKRVADEMADNSVLILMSTASKLYANDVDYVYRQENNLYYLTELAQNGVTLVISKTGDSVSETVFLPKRDARRETWNGRMYSNEYATELSGIINIVDAKEKKAFLASVKSGKSFQFGKTSINETSSIYLLTGKRAGIRFGECICKDAPEQ